MVTRSASICSQTFEDNCLLRNEHLVRCFICDEVVESIKTSILMDTELNIPDKLSQLVGEEYTVIISEEDHLCEMCNELIKRLDQLQNYINDIVRTLSNHLNKKYGLTEETNTQMATRSASICSQTLEDNCLLRNEHLVRCFICDEVVESIKTSILMDTELNIPDKLSQLVGEEYTVIISEEDHLCEMCNDLIKRLDQLQSYINDIVRTLSNHLNKKYGLTEETNTQHINDKELIKKEDYELHDCRMCSFSSNQKDIFDNHIKTHVLDSVKVSNYTGTQSSNLFKYGVSCKTYPIKEECIKHMQLCYKFNSVSDEFELKAEITDEDENKKEEEKEPKLHTCNNCFLTFVDESFLAEHDCTQDSDQEVDEFYLKENESQLHQNQLKCNTKIIEQHDSTKNIIEDESTSYAEANNQPNFNLKVNALSEKVSLESDSDYHLNSSRDLQPFKDNLADVAGQSLDSKNVTALDCDEILPSAEKLNIHCKKHNANVNVENNGEKTTDNELFGFELVDNSIVNSKQEAVISRKEEKLTDENGTDHDFESSTKKKVYVCGECKFRTNLPSDLKAHFLVHLEQNISNKPERTCSICNITFERVARYQSHMKSHENSVGPLNCSYCGIQLHDKLHLRNHNLQNHALHFKKPVCDLCHETFPTFRILKTHKDVKHQGNSIYKCSICDKFFKQKIQLTNHLEYAHRSSPKCRFCDKTIENLKKLREHEYRHVRLQSKKFQCDICSRVFKTHSGLRFHKLRHSGKYPFFCEICGHGFVSIKMLEEHTGVHTKEDRYMCDICGRMFCFYSSYKIHRKWHDNPLPYKCNICNQKFHHTSVLAVHKRRVHTGERPYKCPYCALSFVVSGTYKKHLCLHTQVFPFNCNNCHHGFTTRKKYAIHLAKTHNDYSVLNQGPKKCEYKMSLRKNE